MIVLFRDGVGDGQLSFTVEHEVPQFLSAFDAVVLPDGAIYAPKFTMVIVQKRINTRFFLSNVSCEMELFHHCTPLLTIIVLFSELVNFPILLRELSSITL